MVIAMPDDDRKLGSSAKNCFLGLLNPAKLNRLIEPFENAKAASLKTLQCRTAASVVMKKTTTFVKFCLLHHSSSFEQRLPDLPMVICCRLLLIRSRTHSPIQEAKEAR